MYKVVINQIIDQIGHLSEFDHRKAKTINNSIFSLFKTACLKPREKAHHCHNWLSHPIMALACRWDWALWLVVWLIQSLVTPYNHAQTSIIKRTKAETFLLYFPLVGHSWPALLVPTSHFLRLICPAPVNLPIFGRSAIYHVETLENRRSLVNHRRKPHFHFQAEHIKSTPRRHGHATF